MRVRWVFLGIGLLAVGMLIMLGVAWIKTPRLTDTYPRDGAMEVPVGVSLRLTFSHPMQAETVVEHLVTEPPRSGRFTWEDHTLVFTPDLPWPGGQLVTVRLESGARAATLLALPMGEHRWSFTTGQNLLVYLWPAHGSSDLYGLDLLSGAVRQFTEGAGVLDFSIAPNGSAIFFSAANEHLGTDIYRIDRMQESGSSETLVPPQLIVECGQPGCRAPQVSPDGRYLAYEYLSDAFSGRVPVQVRLLDLVDKESVIVRAPAHETRQPVWSSTGLLALYDVSSQAYVIYNPETQAVNELQNLTGGMGAWSADGSSLVVAEIFYVTISAENEAGSSHLLRYDTRMGTAVDLTVADDLEDAAPVISPDGELMAFARKYLDPGRWTPGRQLWLMNLDGSNLQQLTDDPMYNHYDFSWSPDGQLLAYVRFNIAAPTSPPELWLVNLDGSNPLQLVIGGYSPQWIP